MKYISTPRCDRALTTAERMRDRAIDLLSRAEMEYEMTYSKEVFRFLESEGGKGPLKLAEYNARLQRGVEGTVLHLCWDRLQRARRIQRTTQSRVDRLKRWYFDSKQ